MPILLSVSLAFLLSIAPSVSQEEEDLVERIREIRITLNLGAVAFEELDFSRAIRDLSRILEPYAAGRLGFLSSEESRLLARALELRARAFFNLGEKAKAEKDFAALIRLRVDYRLDRQKISPKVIDQWESVRSRLVSTVSVQLEPIGAEVLLDDRVVGYGPRFEKEVVIGPHELRIQHPGYEPIQETIEVLPAVTLSRKIRLIRNSRDVRFVTVPNRVRIFVDDRPVGVTAGHAPGSYEETARKYSFRRQDASAPLLVPNLSPGIHEIRFERECFVPKTARVEVRLEPETEEPQDFQPVILEPSQGVIAVQGPPGGRIFLDGKPQGVAPAEIDGICAGTHRVEVRGAGSARWFDTIDVKKGQRHELKTTPRRTLAYLGIFAADREGEVHRVDNDSLAEELRSLDRFNRITEDPSDPGSEGGSPGGSAPGKFARLQALVTGVLSRAGRDIWLQTGPVDEEIRKTVRKEFLADLILVGTVPPGSMNEQVVLFLYETSLETPDRVELPGLPARRQVIRFLERLSRPHDLYGPWFGASLVDTLIVESPVVVRVTPDSPARQAGIQPGDEIVSIGSRDLPDHREINRALGEVRPGDLVPVRVRNGTEVEDRQIRISRTPRLLVENRPDMLYANLVSEMRHRSLLASTPEEKNVALLNLGLAYMHFGKYERAIEETFGKIDLPKGPGISYGTVQYYLGICYRKIGREGRAREAFRNAAKQTGSTLGSHDGPLVALRAERILRNLP